MARPKASAAISAVAGERADLALCRGHPAGEQPGAEPDPRRRKHLERKPGPDATGEQGRGEEGRRPECEAEARAEHPSAQHYQDEHELDPGSAGGERAQDRADRGQQAENRDRLDVDAPLADRDREDDQNTAIRGRKSTGASTVGSSRLAGGHQQRPDEGHQANDGGDQ